MAMESVGSILSRAGPLGLLQAPDSGNDRKAEHVKAFYSLAEAREAGLHWEREPPEPEPCVYCGKQLNHLGVRFQNKIGVWLNEPERCDCEQAEKYWHEADEEKARRELAEEEAERNRQKQLRLNRIISNSGIKKRFQTRTFAAYKVNTQNRRAYETAKEYAEHFPIYAETGGGLFFEGSYGTGKTHLAVAVALYLLSMGIPCICKTSIDILDDIKDTFNNNGNVSEKAVLSAYKGVDLLVIDDLGKEMATEWSLATLYSIMNDRYEAMKPTIITTNYNDTALINRMTPRGVDSTNMGAMMSRFKETSKVVTMDWADYRLTHSDNG